MYAELTITASYTREQLSEALIKQIGPNRVDAGIALARTIFAFDPATTERAIAAELIGNTVAIAYFFEGSDTVTAYIFGSTPRQLKAQAERVMRQLRCLLDKPGKWGANVSIFTLENNSSDVPIIEGEYVLKRRRFVEALLEKWLSKLLTPALIFLGNIWTGTPATVSGLIAFGAAGIVFVIEAATSAASADEWKWKDAK
jgi:hypothetical protein